ncbi:hypothetical protein GCG54_00006098 [Colletotrichum gloeosporioides]|uniref:LRR-containing protein second PH domain-containing protein n=1 Tax=Colletotrichum gloeosporioides TaxID=474922 RepID=A0A8H4CM05_COLGL|nr:uncharacterized protein GCG54_00006098 [Colletotrichum gloeosporioides]KAF3806336.1 hypothetical protein GCG54_00006098 [Colletotrichum gloeosporioides]
MSTRESVASRQSVLPTIQTTHHGDSKSPSKSEMRSVSTPSLGGKRRSFLAKTFRKVSSSASSTDLASMAESTSTGSNAQTRRVLHKNNGSGGSNSSSIFYRLNRRASKDSSASSHMSEETPTFLSPNPPSNPVIRILKHGALKTDARLWKSRAEYIVLTETHLVKFNSAEAARANFNELAPSSGRLKRSSTSSTLSTDGSSGDGRVEIPLCKIVNIFNEEGVSPHFGLDVWWSETSPMVSWACTKLFFGLPAEREDWMNEIRRAIRESVGSTVVPKGIVAPNVQSAIHQIVAKEEPSCRGLPLDIFPVVQRTTLLSSKADNPETSKKFRDGSSHYLLLGQNKCYFVRVARTSVYKAPQDIEINTVVFGLTSLVRLKATMSHHEERFVLGFRLPCEAEKRLELASRWYREIVMTFMKADRAVKPAWPQHMQRDIFDIRGLTAQLLLPSGQDFGGLKRTLEAYCATFRCPPPEWTVNWKCERREHCPEFRLLPSKDGGYTPLQLLAVFKSLRYNDYFKALSFRDVDLAPLCGLTDHPGFEESIADVSRDGLVIDGVHKDIIKSAPLLSQEIHAVAFTSGSIRKIDLTNVLASQNIVGVSRTRAGSKKEPEVVRPILLLLRTGSSHCDTLLVGGNPLTAAEVTDLVDVLHIPDILRELDISRCNLDERSLEEIWDALPSQGYRLEALNTSRNIGHVDHMVVKSSLSHFACLRKLSVAGNCLSQFTDPIFFEETIMSWGLEELDLSNMHLNNATLDILAGYLLSQESAYLRRLDLNGCGLSGSQIALLFRSMGQGREIVCSINGNYIENGMEDLSSAIAYNFGPTSLFMDMIEFRDEENYITIIKSLSTNMSIRLLSLVGTSTPGQVSEETCQAVSDFFATNASIQYLDLSGFSAKLDEGQLGLGFSRALSGLASNKTLLHLRIRNQKLNMNIGDLAEAIHMNQTLRTLDVQENSFNLSNLSHMVRSLEQNTSIQEFCPFSKTELNRAIKSSVQNVGMPTGPQAVKNRRASKVLSKATFESFAMEMDRNNALMQNLKEEWTTKSAQIDRILERNRTLAYEVEMARLQWEMPEDPELEWIAYDLSIIFGGLAAKVMKKRPAPNPMDTPGFRGSMLAAGYRGSMMFGTSTPPMEQWEDYSLKAAPHHVSSEEVMDSPATEHASGSSALPTPPEWAPSESPAKEYAMSSSLPSTHSDPRIMEEGIGDFDLDTLKYMIQHGFNLDEPTQAQPQDVGRRPGTSVSTTRLD